MTIEKNEANKRLIEKINQVEEGYTKDFSITHHYCALLFSTASA